ncbi:MAG: hypothetical protein SGCHY_002293 [Lobulomycetales sp.]
MLCRAESGNDSPSLAGVVEVVQSFKEMQSCRVRAYRELDVAHKSLLANPTAVDAYVASTHLISQAMENVNIHVRSCIDTLQLRPREDLVSATFIDIIQRIQLAEREKLEATVKMYTAGRGSDDDDDDAETEAQLRKRIEEVVERINEGMMELQAEYPNFARDAPADTPDNFPPSSLLGKRIARIESVLLQITAPPPMGVSFSDRRKLLSNSGSEYCATASEIVDWVMANCRCLSREEALGFMQVMLEYGYLICCDASERMRDDDSLVTVQAPNMWACALWQPSEGEDYASYLLRRSRRLEISRIPLRNFEVEQLLYLHEKYRETWDTVIETRVQEQMSMLAGFSRDESRTFDLQEFGFWTYHFPSPKQTVIENDRTVRAEKNSGNTEAAYEEAAKPSERLLQHWQSKNQQLSQILQSGTLVSVSESASSLRNFTELFRDRDPLLTTLRFTIVQNPFHTNKPRNSDISGSGRRAKRKLTVSDIRIWVNVFSGLLEDPEGLNCFRDFLAKDNETARLEFWEAVQGLNTISTRQEFVAESIRIYELHIAKGSLKEIKSIFTNTKMTLLEQFSCAENLENLPYNVFDEAEEQVYKLMKTNSWERFRVSNYLLEFFKSRVKRKVNSAYMNPEMLILRK